MAAEVVEFYEPAAEQKGVVFSFRTYGDAAVAGDPVLLAQAVSNLIDNSLKCVAENGAISVQVGPGADGAVEIAVADNGPGIADADKPKATERFFRGDISRDTPGVGLGLKHRRGGRQAPRRGAAAARQPPGPACPHGAAGHGHAPLSCLGFALRCRAPVPRGAAARARRIVASMNASRSCFTLAIDGGCTYIMCPAS